VRLQPAPAAVVLAAVGAAALLADRVVAIGTIAMALFVVTLRAPRQRRWPYLVGSIASGIGIFVVSPFVASEGFEVLWTGPVVPVLGALDVTAEELTIAAANGLRITAASFAFAAYALLVDHDRLLSAAAFARRSAFTAVLATRLIPTLERDAAGLAEAVRGRGLRVDGIRARARLLSPLVASSLERALNLAEAMEARGFGRPGRTRIPAPRWTTWDVGAVAGAGVLVGTAGLWL
jgi:energy-coupling factor transporter transmembrane protein EcfT